MIMNGNLWRRLTRASLHMLWIGALLLALACGKLGSGGGTKVEYQTASPPERIEKMVQLLRDYGNNGGEDTFYKTKDVLIGGRLVTEDNQPIPNPNAALQAMIWSLGRNGSSGMGMSINLKSDGSFSTKIPYGTVYLMANIPGYAVYYANQLTPNERKEIQLGMIPIRRGYPGALKVTDPQGRPIPGVQFRGYFNASSNGNNYYLIGSTNSSRKLVTNAQGVAVLDHASTYSVYLEGVAPGFEKTKWETVQLAPDSTPTLVMKPARPSAGVIVDKRGKQPVAGAMVYLIHAQGGITDQRTSLENAPVMATTGEDGRFTLDTLREDTMYSLLIDAKGYEPLLVRDISANQKDIHLELGPAIVIRGKVLGPEHAPRGQSGRYLTVSQRLWFKNYFTSFERKIPINVRDGVGSFECANLWQGSAMIHRQEVKVTPPGADLTVDLRPIKPANAATTGTRQVIFRFETPEGVLPQGTLAASYSASGRSGAEHILKLTNGETSFTVPYRSQVSVRMNQVAGYWVPDLNQIGVPEASEPLLVPIKTYPAGAIYGEVLEADGKPAMGIRVSIDKQKLPQGVPEPTWSLMVQSRSTSGTTVNRFNAAPLPLGGTYVIRVTRQHTLVVSPPIRLTDHQPLCKLTVSMPPEEKTVSGRIVDKTGRPLANISVGLRFESSAEKQNYWLGNVTTSADGRFAFEQVNPGAPGSYTLDLSGTGWQNVKIPARPGSPMRDIAMEPGCVIKGVVIDAETGKPLAGIDVTATRTEKRRNVWGKEIRQAISTGAQTNARGEFKFDMLMDDQYQIDCQGCDMNKRVTVTAGEAAPLTLTVTMQNYLKQQRAGETDW